MAKAALTLELRTAEVLDHILPVRRVVESSQIGLELSAENFKSCTLADTVRSNKTENISGPWHGKTMELEAVGRITVGDLTLKVRGQVDDGDGTEGAPLGTDTATDA